MSRLRAVCLAASTITATLSLSGPSAVAQDTGDYQMATAIQDRIESATPGSVVMIPPGAYHGNLLVDVPVTLRGVEHPLIHGDGTGSVITVTAPGTVIEGLVVRNSAPGPVGGPAGVRIEADRVTVRDVVIEDTYMGIAVFGARGTKIVGNVVRGREDAVITDEGHAVSADTASPSAMPDMPGMDVGSQAPPTIAGQPVRGDGISLWNSKGTLVRDNVVEHARDGIYMSFGTDVLIDRNRVVDSRYAIHNMYAKNLTVAENTFERNLSGLVLMYGGPVLVLRNEIRDSSSRSTGFGILLKDVFGCEAVENLLVANRIGIQIDGPAGDIEHPITVHGNTVALNQFGVSLYPSAHATFHANSFVENTVQVVAQGTGVAGKNTWTHDGAGNYWSDYRGYDLGGEGIGDIPHVEGGAVENLVVRAPVLQALASGPAFGLLRAVEDRWVEHDPVVVDRLPLMRPHSPPLEDGVTGGGASAALAGAGLAAFAFAVAALVALRRPLRRPLRRRRWSRVPA